MNRGKTTKIPSVGRHGWAFLMGAIVLAGGIIPASGGTTYYSGKGTANGGLSTAVKWYTDESRTVAADPQPTPTANDGNTYVFIESMKMDTGATFPEGTHVCFGTDGNEIGTSARQYYPNCSSGTWTVPDGTVYGLTFVPNWNASGQFLGNYRLVKTTMPIVFGSSALQDGRTYGMYLAGKFTGESDVLIAVTIVSYGGGTGTGISRTVFNGDFSGYKGKFAASSVSKGINLLWFASATSMGDPDTPFTDAVTLRNNARLRIDEVVTQTSARGITLDLSSGQSAYLYAPANVSWTLRAPVYGGSVGTLVKTEAGTVTLAGSLEAKNILVEAGTLVVDTTASFAAGTVITVAPGAKLVNKTISAAIPNVTVVVQDGGTYVYDTLTAIPFDGTDVTPLDCTGMTVTELSVLSRPIPVGLSQAIPLPFSETNRWAIATFDAARGLSAADFTDVTAKSFHRLPTTWLETATENGVTTLYLVARPAVEYRPNTSSLGQRMGTASHWTDGQLPHAGKDYFSRQGLSYNRTGDGSNIASFNFNGESLTVNGGIGAYAQNFFATELRLRADNELLVAHGNQNVYWPRIFRGRYDIDETCTDSQPAKVSIDTKTTFADLRVEFVGSGTFRVNTGVKSAEDGGYGIFPLYLSGMSTNFTGRFDFTTFGSTSFMDLYVTNGAAFGGPLPAYSADAVRLRPPSTEIDHLVSITAMADTTVDAANRGWHMTSGTLGASNGVTFVFSPPTLTVTTKLCKTGGGTLAMGCDTIGAGTAFAVEEGYVKALSAGCCTNLNLAVTEGAGIKADLAPTDETVAAKGLIAKSILPAEAGGTILVAPDIPQDFAMPPKFSVVACTVPAEQADLTDALRAAYVSKYTGRIEKDAETFASEGLVTYSATWTKTGFTVIFR